MGGPSAASQRTKLSHIQPRQSARWPAQLLPPHLAEQFATERARIAQEVGQFRNILQRDRLASAGIGRRVAYESVFDSPRRLDAYLVNNSAKAPKLKRAASARFTAPIKKSSQPKHRSGKLRVISSGHVSARSASRSTNSRSFSARRGKSQRAHVPAATPAPSETPTRAPRSQPPAATHTAWTSATVGGTSSSGKGPTSGSSKWSPLGVADLLEAVKSDPDDEHFFASKQKYHVNRYHLVGVGGRPASNHPFQVRHHDLSMRDALKSTVRKRCQSTRNPFAFLPNSSDAAVSTAKNLKRATHHSGKGGHVEHRANNETKPQHHNGKTQIDTRKHGAEYTQAARAIDAYKAFCASEGIAASSRIIDMVLASLNTGTVELMLTFQSLRDADIAGLQRCMDAFIDSVAGDSLRELYPAGGIHLNLCGNSITERGCKHLRDMLRHPLPIAPESNLLVNNQSDESDSSSEGSVCSSSGRSNGGGECDSESGASAKDKSGARGSVRRMARENMQALVNEKDNDAPEAEGEATDELAEPRLTIGGRMGGRRASRRSRLRATMMLEQFDVEGALNSAPKVSKARRNKTNEDADKVVIPENVRTGFFLTSLDLSDNRVRNAGVVCVLDAAINDGGAQLAGLALRGNLLTDRIANKMSKYLNASRSTLRTLDMSQNRLGANVSTALCAAMKKTMSKLSKLSLSWNPLGNAGGIAIAQGLAHCPSIESVDLSFASLGDEAGVALASMLQDGHVPSLRLLDVSHNHFTGTTATAFGKAIVATGQGLTELRAGFNKFGFKASLSLIHTALNADKLTDLCIENALDMRDGTEESMQKLYSMAQSVMHKVQPKHMHISVEFPPRHRSWANALHGDHIEVAPKLEKKAHVVEAITDSIFASRVMESESRAFYDSARTLDRAFKEDWAAIQDKLKRFIKAVPECGLTAEACIEMIKEIVKTSYIDISNIFRFYSSSSSPADAIGMNDFLDLVDDCKLNDGGIGGTLPMSKVEIIFVQANYELQSQSDNPDTALCRYELIECLVRAAQAKYMCPESPVRAKHIGEALTMVLQQHVLVHCDRYDSNLFRNEQLYFQDMHDIFAMHRKCISVVWKHIAEDDGQMSFREWKNLLRNSNLLSDDFTVLEGTYAFYLSTMRVGVEMGPRSSGKHDTLSYVEFLEAIAHVAEWNDCERLGLPEDALVSQKVGKLLFKVFHNCLRGNKKLERNVVKEYFLRMDPMNSGRCEEEFEFLRARHVPLTDESKAKMVVGTARENSRIVAEPTVVIKRQKSKTRV